MKTLRILLVDDHALIRRGARALLQSRRGWRVIDEAMNGIEAVEKATTHKPDVAIVDLSMPELDGMQVVRRIREAVPTTKILVLTMHESDQMVQCALHAGAHGYILKSDLTECLVKAVKDVAEGKRFLTPKVSEIVLNGFLKKKGELPRDERPSARTTPREVQIIRLLADGKANKEIAAQLGITVRTVETHRAKVMQKLGMHSLVDLIRYALGHGIVPAQESPTLLNPGRS